jgi:uncharacterized protein YaaQ
MKLLIAILSDTDVEDVLRALVERGFRATRIASTGGFLRRGNSTLLVGLESDRVDAAIELIREVYRRTEDHGQRRATVFVLDVSRYDQLP